MRSYPLMIAALLTAACSLGAATTARAACGEPSGCPTPEPPPPPRPPPKQLHQDHDPKALIGNPYGRRGAETAPSGNPEFVFAGSPAQIAKANDILIRLGAVVLRQKSLGSLGASLLIVDPNGLSVDTIRSALAKRSARVTIDRNSIYKTATANDDYAPHMVGVPAAAGEAGCPLARHIAIGLVDGPIDPQSAALKGVTLHSRLFLSQTDVPGETTHATDLATLIAASANDGLTTGLAPGTSIISAVTFAHSPDGDIARMDGVAEALDWLTGQNVSVINMSLTGPRNDSLAYILDLVARAGPVMLAATGNDGAQGVSYPASDPNVIAVTAVDAAKHLYRQANRGPEVDFAAPGVDLLINDGTGARHLSGTSYATAVGTALTAHLLAKGTKGVSEVEAQLKGTAEDLGPAGRDDAFGWGLMRLAGCKN